MVDTFEHRVRSAAVSGWWTLLIAVIFLTLVWCAYLFIATAQPAWFLSLSGPGITWPMMQNTVLWIVAVLKLCVWLMAIVVIWLTLWAQQLKKGSKGR